MEIALVTISAVAATLTAIWLASRLLHFVRFRKPVFLVQGAELLITERAGYKVVGPGHFELSIRGADQPVTLTKQEIEIFQAIHPRGGFGTDTIINLAPFAWTRVSVPFSVGFELNELPRNLDIEIYLTNPRDSYVVPVRLGQSDDGSRYTYEDPGYMRRHLRRTVLRPRARLYRFVRAIFRRR